MVGFIGAAVGVSVGTAVGVSVEVGAFSIEQAEYLGILPVVIFSSTVG